jgi:hypothetical protein
MLLDEFLSEHNAFVEQQRQFEQQGRPAQLQKQVEGLTAGLQKVSAQLVATNSPLADLQRAHSHRKRCACPP